MDDKKKSAGIGIVGGHIVSGDIVGKGIILHIATQEHHLSQDQAFERIGAAVRLNLDQLKDNIAQARNESSQFFKLTLIFASLEHRKT